MFLKSYTIKQTNSRSIQIEYYLSPKYRIATVARKVCFFFAIMQTNQWNVPVMADLCHRDGSSGAPTAEERNMGEVGSSSEVLKKGIQRSFASTLLQKRIYIHTQ